MPKYLQNVKTGKLVGSIGAGKVKTPQTAQKLPYDNLKESLVDASLLEASAGKWPKLTAFAEVYRELNDLEPVSYRVVQAGETVHVVCADKIIVGVVEVEGHGWGWDKESTDIPDALYSVKDFKLYTESGPDRNGDYVYIPEFDETVNLLLRPKTQQ